MVYSGMGPDFRVLVSKARKSAQAYWKIYGEYPPTRVLVQELASVMQEATQSGPMQRRFWKRGQMTEKTIEIGIVGESTARAVGGDGKVMPVFKKLTEAEIKDYLAL
ncbi:20s proteasome subunit [Ceraceosorus bombacis]|uniref:20s proteasome subunit n=1 Tax=Ceraceosorus bombacis TaxID=401625 RepID=A0A0P1B7W9_9BASI|nr:20s proteasome subunit [Ceraceosorus bombacis]